MALTPEQLVETVDRSPACVAAQDKAAWLALFAPGGQVEDPVGSAVNVRGGAPDPRTGEDDLGRFWDTFIAGNRIEFSVRSQVVRGNALVRDVVIHTRLSTGLAIEVPAYLIYELVEEPTGPRLARLRACWDLRTRSRAALRTGPGGLWAMAVMSARMLRVQPPGWILAYARGLTTGIQAAGAQAAERLARTVTARDLPALASLFTPQGAVHGASAGQGEEGAPPALALAAWSALHVSEPISAGWLTGLRLQATVAGAPVQGLGFLEFDPATRRIARARLFLEGGR